MKILALQLKRIGDLILTAPALAAVRRQFPNAHITLVVADACRELLPALAMVDERLVVERLGGNGALWLRMLFQSCDVCLDFTGNDRSALFSVLSKAPRRVTYEWVKKSPRRAWFYNEFIASSVRERHTVDHYLDLAAEGLGLLSREAPEAFTVPPWAREKAAKLLGGAGLWGPFAVVHPGTARPEKYWVPERWATVMTALQLPCILTGSRDGYEQEHLAAIKALAPVADLSGKLDLLTLAAVIEKAALVLSVDSAPMHLAATFGRPQVALFGPTNPFHWRPRHDHARVLVAGSGVVTDFQPRMQGGAMSLLSPGAVCDAISSLDFSTASP